MAPPTIGDITIYIAFEIAARTSPAHTWQSYLRAFVRDLEIGPDTTMLRDRSQIKNDDAIELDENVQARFLISAARLEDIVGDLPFVTALDIVKSIARSQDTAEAEPKRIEQPLPALREQVSAPWWASLLPPAIPLTLLLVWLIRRTARKRAYLESRQPEAPPVVHNLVSRAFERGAVDQAALAVASQRLYRRVLGEFSSDLTLYRRAE